MRALLQPLDDWRHRVPENNGEPLSGNQPIDAPPEAWQRWHRDPRDHRARTDNRNRRPARTSKD